MSLDEIVNDAERYSQIKSLAEAIEKDSSNPELYGPLAGYMINFRGISQNDAFAMVNAPEMTERKARQYSGTYAAEDQRTLAEKVIASANEVINATDIKHLQQMALSIPGGNDRGRELNMLAEQERKSMKDYDFVKNELADKYEDPIWKDFVMNAGAHFLENRIQYYANEAANKFARENFVDEVTVTENGKDKLRPVVNEAKLKAYVAKALNSLKEDKEKVEWYSRLGISYDNTVNPQH